MLLIPTQPESKNLQSINLVNTRIYLLFLVLTLNRYKYAISIKTSKHIITIYLVIIANFEPSLPVKI
jgi:hypothetical protein